MKHGDEEALSGTFWMVGIGASAGGLEALEEFFGNVPEHPGMSFIVVTHLQPGRISLLPEILRRRCALPVVEIHDSTRVEPDCVYVAPAGVNLNIVDGTLRLAELPATGPRNLPIDHFFTSLARDQHERAVGIVLSGTGSDGTLGLKEIRAASGLSLAQEELSARYASMPHSAIAARHVDHVLPADQMPNYLLEHARRGARPPLEITPGPGDGNADVLQDIFQLLRSRTRHDFSSYKASTISRRIERRMNVHHLDNPGEYLRYLQANPGELDRLHKELLIGVTSFFRDPEAFESLAALLPGLLADRPDEHHVRVWVPGCSTGEEAYSIAILLYECIEQTKSRCKVQIFATDLDTDAVDAARAGSFPESVAADLGSSRLERFFHKEERRLRINKDIREMLIFAQQNVIDDPPFTRLDLLSCRNILIYFDSSLQRRLLPMFHYALRPGGLLFLGSSETIGNFNHLFEPVDKKWKLFRTKKVMTGSYPAELPSSLRSETSATEQAHVSGVRKASSLGGTQLAERALLQHLVPATVLMHERGEIVHIHGRTGLFLEPAPGPQSLANIYNMAREGLQLDLAMAVRQARTADSDVLRRGIRVRAGSDTILVDLRVKKLTQPEGLRGLYLVAFERPEPVGAKSDVEAGDTSDVSRATLGRVTELESELQQAREVHQSTIEELETANEELKSANEELQSTNEELQSTNEELETSKEEMQSLNEELQTVNGELQSKVDELSRANDDMKNLLNGTDIATMFLDDKLHIMRYTEQATKLIRLIPSDVGRPIYDLVPRLYYDRFVDDAREVLRTLALKETEVQSEDGPWYLMRILPYRTKDNVIDGLVVTFVDVTKLRGLQEETRRVLTALKSSPMTVFGLNAELRYEWACSSVFDRTPEDVVGKTDFDILRPDDAEALTALKRRVMGGRAPVRERVRLLVGGRDRIYDMYMEPVASPSGEVGGMTGVVTEIADGSP